jgi:PilZ domain
MQSDQRAEYRTLAQGAQVFYRCERSSPPEQRYLVGVADNMSLGGLFVTVRHPPATGTILSLHIYSGTDIALTKPLCAKAIVRWRRQWGKPRGMGVQFLELEGLGDRRLEHWLATIIAPAPQSRPAPPAAA